MAKPYSDDFREKVMQAIELDGLKKSEASQLFNISRNTINLWFSISATIPLTCGFSAKPKRVMSSQSQGKHRNTKAKLAIERSFGSSSKSRG
jgi:hypothetical protein